MKLSTRARHCLGQLQNWYYRNGPSYYDKQWEPSETLLLRLTIDDLKATTNCGSITLREILEYAKTRGVDIK